MAATVVPLFRLCHEYLMPPRPAVSVVVITYRQENMVAETLRSIINQSIPPDEIILADDASPDKTVAVATRILKESGLTHKIVTVDKNTGITANCNRGFEAASGDFIALIAGDDIMAPAKLEKQAGALAANPAASICHTNMHWFDDATGKILRLHHPAGSQRKLTSLRRLIKNNYIGGPSIMVRRKLLPSPAFNPALPMVSDWLFNLEAAARGTIIYLPAPLTRYRVHANNISRKDLSTEELLTISLFEKSHPKKYRCAIRTARSRIHRARATNLLLNNRPKAALPHLIHAWKYNPLTLLPYAMLPVALVAVAEQSLPIQPVAALLAKLKARRTNPF